ncbi:LexA family transcriptional regulator [Desulfovibrio cuneatus]|uniref:LexA family transcriptional regulator n=1 Tax=Desulfovibrio cuneatus TaxID=159728 RepID=UPI0003FB6802|nr:S24 family peptidase [Desulfovibrio cuneatus]
MLEYMQEGVREYIIEAVQLVGGVDALAKIAGVTSRAVYAWKSGKRMPRHNKIQKIQVYLDGLHKAYGSTPLPQGMQKPGAQGGSQVTTKGIKEGLWGTERAGCSHLCFVAPGMGYEKATDPRIVAGSLFYGPKAAELVSVPQLVQAGTHRPPVLQFSYGLLAGLTLTPESLRMLVAEDRCMEPCVHKNDVCLVDSADSALKNDAVYVFCSGENVFVRRVCRLPEGIVLRCDNREVHFLDFTLPNNPGAIVLNVLGRIVWVGKRL